MNILCISGSVRKKSSSLNLLNSFVQLSNEKISIKLSRSLDLIPHFNPDLDLDGQIVLSEVQEWRDELKNSDAIIITSPEYAHGVPGVLKNALDWIVSSGEFYEKNLVLFLDSRAKNMEASLTLTLKVMTANILEEANLRIDYLQIQFDEDGNLKNESIILALKNSLDIIYKKFLEETR